MISGLSGSFPDTWQPYNADDTKLVSEVNNSYDSEQLQKDLDSLGAWADEWQLRFNILKCMVMHLGGVRNGGVSYYMLTANDLQPTYLQETKLEKDFGLWFSDTLSPGEQSNFGVNQKNFHLHGLQLNEALVHIFSKTSLGIRECSVAPLPEKGH